jgi:hypothetical protein
MIEQATKRPLQYSTKNEKAGLWICYWRNDFNDLSYITSRELDLMTHFSQLQDYYTSLATFKCESLTFVVAL